MGNCQSSERKRHLTQVMEAGLTPCTLVDFKFEDLPQELLSIIARHFLALNLPALLCLCTVSKVLHGKLTELREAATMRRVGWVKELSVSHTISNEDRTLTLNFGLNPWACGVPLPIEGRYSLSMHVETGKYGNVIVGVCNAFHCGWGLCLSSGKMSSFSFPKGLAIGEATQIIFDAAGRPANLKGRAEGAVIEIIVDCGECSLSFGVNGESPRRVPDFAFPPSIELRPWARLYGYTGDSLWMRGYFQPVSAGHR